MQHNLIWKGIEYHTIENCIIGESGGEVKVKATIVGYYEDDLLKVDYYLYANERWETRELDLQCQLRNEVQRTHLRHDGRGHWWLQGEIAPQFDNCIDVDITLTCLTNTLPIRRLNFEERATHEIGVVYCNILERSVLPVRQQYTRLSAQQYKFENVPNDFEAVIDVDAAGLVMYYPGLFERAILVDSQYKL